MNELKKKLLQLCNESKLPLEAILFVVRDLYRDVDETYRQYEAAAQAEQSALEQKQEDVK